MEKLQMELDMLLLLAYMLARMLSLGQQNRLQKGNELGMELELDLLQETKKKALPPAPAASTRPTSVAFVYAACSFTPRGSISGTGS